MAKRGLAEEDAHDERGSEEPYEPAHSKRRPIALVGALALVLILGVAGFFVFGDQLRPAPEPLPVTVPVAISGVRVPHGAAIGVVVTLGGGTTTGAEWNGAANGARVAQQRLAMAGTELGLAVENDHGTAEGARQAVAALLSQQVAGIVVATTGPQVNDALAVAQAAGVPVVLAYTTAPADQVGIWSLAPDDASTVQAFTVALKRFHHPLHINAGPGLPAALQFADTVAVGSSDDLTEVAAEVARRTNADTSAAGAYPGGPDDSTPPASPVDDPNDVLVISGHPVNQALIVRALQAKNVPVPIMLSPGATSPVFAATLSDQGGAPTNVTTVGAAWSDSVALTSTAQGRAMSAFLTGVRLIAEDKEVLDLTGEAPFSSVAEAADVRSHDAVVTLARAISAAGSTEGSRVRTAASTLTLGAGDGIAGPALDLTKPQALTGGLSVLGASSQHLGLRPGSAETVERLAWFAAPTTP